MIGKTLNEFIETLTYGYEIEFKYQDRYFIVQGDTVNGNFEITLDECNNPNSFETKDYYEQNVYSGNSFEECVTNMLKSPFIDGKTLFEIEDEIQVLFG